MCTDCNCTSCMKIIFSFIHDVQLMILYMMIRELDQEKHKTFINVVNVAFAIFAAEE